MKKHKIDGKKVNSLEKINNLVDFIRKAQEAQDAKGAKVKGKRKVCTIFRQPNAIPSLIFPYQRIVSSPIILDSDSEIEIITESSSESDKGSSVRFSHHFPFIFLKDFSTVQGLYQCVGKRDQGSW